MMPADILIVEENREDLKIALRARRKVALTTHAEIARDGAKTMDFVFCEGVHMRRKFEDSPKVILLDLKLFKMDCLKVLPRIKADPRTMMIPVGMMTSSREHRDLLGAKSYIVKRVTFDHFTAAVQQVGFYWLSLSEGALHE